MRKIVFATEADYPFVYELFIEHDMDVYGDITDHVVLMEDGEVCAAACMVQTDERNYHLENIAVAGNRKHNGYGGGLLAAITEKPWACCQPSSEPEKGAYRVSTVARGNAVEFYARYGFTTCGFTDLDPQYQNQCDECPDRIKCSPVPMIFTGRI